MFTPEVTFEVEVKDAVTVMAADVNETPKCYKRKRSIPFPESTIKIGKKFIIIYVNIISRIVASYKVVCYLYHDVF